MYVEEKIGLAQQATDVKNMGGFIVKAIRENYQDPVFQKELQVRKAEERAAMPQGTPHPTVIPFLKVYIALTAPERTDSQSMLQGGTDTRRHRLTVYATRRKPRLTVYATISIRNGISICNTERPLCFE